MRDHGRSVEEALKKGRDCTFAYILFSVQSVKSTEDVEQLLGRVLRMLFVQRRVYDKLNQAWAFVVSPDFTTAAKALHDRMVENMGFDVLEAARAILPTTEPLFDHGPDLFNQTQVRATDLIITLPARGRQVGARLRERSANSFWLPTSTDYFYPGFVCQVKDGRLLVVECKGGYLTTAIDALEKEAIGKRWAETSHNGRVMFVQVSKGDPLQRSLETQWRDALRQPNRAITAWLFRSKPGVHSESKFFEIIQADDQQIWAQAAIKYISIT